ncbi:MAG: tyrosine-protein phosphatase [Planctomycetota bacterium]|jgi:protein-tyrosine phosphatase
MIDLHHHCLPGVDDGPGALEDAVEQIAAAERDGITTIVATPHRRHPQYDVPPETAREAHDALRSACRDKGIATEILLGSEIHYSDGIASGLADGTNLDLGGNGRWFLFELPASHVPAHMDRMVFEMQLAGWFPLLAHPERNVELVEDTGKLEALRNQGVRTQITAMSITGEFGRRAKKASERWLKKGLVDVLATDAHDVRRRPPLLRAAVERAASLIGQEAARALVDERPQRILRGEELD